jgi:hypothetical protein
MGERHANGWRVSRHRLVADVTVDVIANPMSVRDIRGSSRATEWDMARTGRFVTSAPRGRGG